MAKKTLQDVSAEMLSLLDKIDEIEAGYNNALKDAEERYKQAEEAYNAKYEEVKELHKMKVLKQITDETYQQVKEELDKLEEKVRDIGYEIEQIEGYKREDKEEVLAKLNEIKGEYNQKKQEEVRRIQLQLLKAKLEYLKKLIEMRKEFIEISKADYRYQQLLVDLGYKPTTYISGVFESIGTISIAGSGYESLDISTTDIYNALTYGRLPYQLEKAVSEAEEKGII
jgi:DNA repair exonuclease SbcCD ATPase subunit